MLLSNPATYDQRPLKEAHSLAKAGRSVKILAWDRELETEADSLFSDGVEIIRFRLHAGHGTPFLTIPRLFLFYVWSLAHLLTWRVDAVHSHDVDTLPVGLAAKLLKLNRTKLVYDMHDLPEAFLRFFPLTSVTSKFFLTLAKKWADAVVVVNDLFVGYLVRIGFSLQRLVVVMNSPPLANGRLSRRESVGDFRVLYYGWLGEERGVKLLIAAMHDLNGVELTLAGRGELRDYVVEATKDNPLIRYAGWLKMRELEPMIRQADLIPSLYEPRTKNAQLASPGKLLTAMSLSIPSLVPRGSYQADIVEKYKCGLVVDWGDPEEVRDAIRRLSADLELYNELASSGYAAFRTSFSWEVMEERLAAAYVSLIGRPGPGIGPGD